jgi:uncharacterized membrane protein YccC
MSASASPANGSLQLRLSEQLQALSLVGETLTLRLLELEERLAGLEAQLEGLEQQQSSSASSESTDVLAATEERIARLEDLLNEQSPARQPQGLSSSATVHPLHRPNAEAVVEADEFNEPELELHPFPEEEEQPFMDELSA